jgi:uncharacterized protein YecE (DUF72 family)
MPNVKPKIFIGTSGWVYKDWTGPFYPQGLKAEDRLQFYAQRFRTIEINATFYRLPSQNMLDAWNRNLSSGFHLVVKGSRFITHIKKIQDCQAAVTAFYERVLQLKTLKVVLWQLPPTLPKDTKRLDAFLGALPRDVRHAVEFRHASWWDEETKSLLAQHRAAFVIVSHPSLPDDIWVTTDFLYLRFHGLGQQLYSYGYSQAELAQWAKRLRPELQGKTLYAFFTNDYHAYAPHDAQALMKILTPSSK